MSDFIPYGKQWIDDEDKQAVLQVLESDFLTQGPEIMAFESEFAQTVGAKYAVAVSNGTAALHVAMLALGIGPGDEVITTPNTFLASANCILYVGATPRFVDINLDDYTIDAAQIEAAITPNTKAIIPVHFAGVSCDMQRIKQIADTHNLAIIEDGCHALGTNYQGAAIGACTFSNMTVFSFHPVKTIAAGEGGMITTNDSATYETLCQLRCHGMTKDPQVMSQNPGPWYYEMVSLGYNYRMTDIQAALGRSQLKKLAQFKARRQDIVAKYNREFVTLEQMILPSSADLADTCHHLYVVRIDFMALGITRAEVMDALRSMGIGTQVHYIPLYEQPYYQAHCNKNGDFPNMSRYYAQALSLPLYPKMSDADILAVITAVRAVLK
ncbi:MAG: UDP-4-amino-4,6-dideoxy-N-acetyl-beta-L-altrosamine transaminase [bacterium]|nr:UDP-4-amino-4,6-dideoxy-N-acetyl-beta-L-altrosamine transaminase [bacterium]